MTKRIILTGGGTAGHVTPNLALIPKLQRDGWEVHYIGSYDGIEKELVARLPGVTYHGIASGKLRRYLDPRNLSDPFRVVKGAFQASALVSRIRPSVIFSKGGFVSVPVVLAGRTHGVPVVVHESDRTSGLANRMAIPMARVLCATFPEAAEAAGPKGVHTGPPIRPELFAGKAEKGFRICSLKPGLPLLLIMGGSSGSKAVNEAIEAALPNLLRTFQVAHIRGKGNLNPDLHGKPGYCQFEYVGEGLPDLLAASDMVISRAGSNAIWEFVALGKPLLLIPLPLTASRGDQIANAEMFDRAGYAHVLRQEDMTPDSLFDAIHATWIERETIVRAQRLADASGGLDRLYREILGAAKP